MIYILKLRAQNLLIGNNASPHIRKPPHNRRLSPNRECATDTHDPVTKQRIRQTQKLPKCWINVFQPLYRVPLLQTMGTIIC